MSVPAVRTSVRLTIPGFKPFLGVVTYSHIASGTIDVWAPPAVTITHEAARRALE